MVWKTTGRLVFWLCWPAIWVLIRFGRRTRILLIYRDEFLVLSGWLGSGKWSLPGGGLHRGEDSKSGLLREVKEEIGLQLSSNQIELGYKTNPQNKFLKFSYDLYVCKLPEKPDLTLQRSEIRDYAWQSLNNPSLPLAKDCQEAVGWWLNKG